jgi:hypothetical protein
MWGDDKVHEREQRERERKRGNRKIANDKITNSSLESVRLILTSVFLARHKLNWDFLMAKL